MMSTRFLNYNDFDNAKRLSNKLDENLLKALKKEASFGKTILEVGCGTGQLSIALAHSSNNIVVGLDATLSSLYLADQFLDREQSPNCGFIHADLFENIFGQRDL